MKGTATGVLAGFLLLGLSGCVSGGNTISDGPSDGLSGGSVPSGGDVDVQVVQVDSVARALALSSSGPTDRGWPDGTAWQTVTGAFVRVQDHGGAMHYPYTVADGHFGFTGVPEGNATLIVRPPTRVPGLMGRSVKVRITKDKPASFVVWLGEETPNARVDGITISPATITVAPGQTVDFDVEVTGSEVDELLPVWTFHGTGGVLQPDGTFKATEAGLGVVIVTLDDQSASAVVIVDDSILDLVDHEDDGG